MRLPVFILVLLGIADTIYLSYEHLANIIPPCPAHSILGSFIDCNQVLTSVYSQIYGIPLAYLGLLYYLVFLVLLFKLPKKLLLLVSALALIGSTFFVYLQLFVLHAICLYCMASAGINLLIFLLLAADFVKKVDTQKATQDTKNN